MAVKANFDLQMQFSGSGGAWTSVIADVSGAVPIRASYGIDGNTPHDRVAGVGTLSFELDNTSRNSGAVVGYYSPGHASVRSGFAPGMRARLAITYSGSTFYKFHGTVDDIRPIPSLRGPRRTRVTALDWMDEALTVSTAAGWTIQTGQTAAQIIATAVGLIARAPAASTLAPSQTEFPYAFDTLRDERDRPFTEILRAVDSDLGYLFIKGDTTTGGVLTYQDRRARQNAGSAVVTLSNSQAELDVNRSRQQVYTEVHVTVHPRRVDTSEVTLFTLGNTPLPIAASGSVSFIGYYTDPNQQAVRVGALSLTGENYTFGVSTGDDSLDNSLIITSTVGANSIEYTLTNDSSSDGILSDFSVTGLGLYDYDPHTTRDTDSSDYAYGKRFLDLDLPHEFSYLTAAAIAAYYAAKYETPRDVVDSVSFPANASDALMTAALQREPGDVIALSETVTGLSSSRHFIQKVTLELRPPGLLWCTWGLAPQIDTDQYWQLDISQLGGDTEPTTRLAL
jgi:hypothetical protein